MKRKLPPKRKTIPVSREFQELVWALVNKSPGCWQWEGLIDAQGYGMLTVAQGHIPMAARVVWELLYGPLPKGRLLLQECKNRSCVRPDHRRIATRTELAATDVDRKRRVKIPKNSEVSFLPPVEAEPQENVGLEPTDVSRETSRAGSGTTSADSKLAIAIDADAALSTRVLISSIHSQHRASKRLNQLDERIADLISTVTSVHEQLAARITHLENAPAHPELLLRLSAITEQLGALAQPPDAAPEAEPDADAGQHRNGRTVAPPTRTQTAEALGRLFESTLAVGLDGMGLLMVEEVFELALEHAEHDGRLALDTFRNWLGVLSARVADGEAEPSARALRALAYRDLGLGLTAGP